MHGKVREYPMFRKLQWLIQLENEVRSQSSVRVLGRRWTGDGAVCGNQAQGEPWVCQMDTLSADRGNYWGIWGNSDIIGFGWHTIINNKLILIQKAD